MSDRTYSKFKRMPTIKTDTRTEGECGGVPTVSLSELYGAPPSLWAKQSSLYTKTARFLFATLEPLGTKTCPEGGDFGGLAPLRGGVPMKFVYKCRIKVHIKKRCSH